MLTNVRNTFKAIRVISVVLGYFALFGLFFVGYIGDDEVRTLKLCI